MNIILNTILKLFGLVERYTDAMSIEQAMKYYLDKHYPFWTTEGELGNLAPKFFEEMIRYFNDNFYIDQVEDIEADILSLSGGIHKAYLFYKNNYQVIRIPKLKQYFQKLFLKEVESGRMIKENFNKEYLKYLALDNKKVYVKLKINERLL